MKSFYLVTLTILVAGFALSARADEPNRASKILTTDLAQKILGTPVEANVMNNLGDTEIGKNWSSTASYTGLPGGTSAPGLTLSIRHSPSAADAKLRFEANKDNVHGDDFPGLGDAAYRTKTPLQLHVLKGTDWLVVSAEASGHPDAALQEKAARAILGKLPNP